jgi:hypothetical protein
LRLIPGLAFAGVLVAFPVRAQDSGIAEQLFIEGKALMQEKQYEKACAKLKASHDIDRTATGTLLNLALCHELTNKPATAWAEFRQVAAESIGRREDRVALAHEHEQKLFPILSWVRVVVSPAARVPDLAVRLDKGLPIGEASWGTELPIDPGQHVLEVSAPKKVSVAIPFVVAADASRRTLEVTALADVPPAAVLDEPTNESERLAAERAATRRIIGYVLGGTGLVAVGVGLAFGLVADSRNTDAKALCPGDVCADEPTRAEASSQLASANSAANISNLTVGVGSLLVVTGVVLVLTALPSKAGPATGSLSRWRAAPVPLAGGGAMLVGGAF